MTKLARYQFSLATMLLVAMWSAVGLWMNTTEYVVPWFVPPDCEFERSVYGLPWYYWSAKPYAHWRQWALAGDAVIGVLLVVVLTWGSTLLLRVAKHVFRPTSRLRFQFSLATLLLLAMWSAVVFWLNTRSQVTPIPGHSLLILKFGCPWHYADFACDPVFDPGMERLHSDYDALAGDAVVGALLVVVLTWGSTFLLRVAKHVFRRPLKKQATHK